MVVTLAFPTYSHLSGFLAKTGNSSMEINLKAKTLSARFSAAEIGMAKEDFAAIEKPNETADSPVSRNQYGNRAL